MGMISKIMAVGTAFSLGFITSYYVMQDSRYKIKRVENVPYLVDRAEDKRVRIDEINQSPEEKIRSLAKEGVSLEHVVKTYVGVEK